MNCPSLGVLAFLFVVGSGVAAAEETSLQLCADEWMPYNGTSDPQRPGYAIELTRAIFEPKGIKVEFSAMPWEKALAAVRSGEKSGAIGANKQEGAGLVLPNEKIGAPSLCLMTRAESKWTYDNLSSFRNVRFGAIKDYSYWPDLDAYIARSTGGKGIVMAEGESPLDDLMKKLQGGDVDVLGESEPVLLWYLRSHGLDRTKFRVVYKGEPDPIFIAFAATADGRRFAGLLDEGIRALRASGELEKILKRYGLRDWQ